MAPGCAGERVPPHWLRRMWEGFRSPSYRRVAEGVGAKLKGWVGKTECRVCARFFNQGYQNLGIVNAIMMAVILQRAWLKTL
jgi:hypothetical protein